MIKYILYNNTAPFVFKSLKSNHLHAVVPNNDVDPNLGKYDEIIDLKANVNAFIAVLDEVPCIDVLV